MPKEAEQLRDLAARIERVTAAHPMFSMAHDRVRVLCDDLCARARIIELTAMLPRTDDR